MESLRQILRWRPTKRQVLVTTGIAAVVTAIIGLVLTIYVHGFTPETAALVTALATLVGVLITQVVNTNIASLGQINAQRLANEQARNDALQSYLEQMGKLLTDPDQPLYDATLDDNLSIVARAQTLAVLQGLDSTRKRILLQFLYESALIHKDKRIVNLSGANLIKANLLGSVLIGADLSTVDLSEANLTGAFLMGAILEWAVLNEANLSRADLSTRAVLSKAILHGADLSSAVLTEVNLTGASLRGANLSEANLNTANASPVDLTGADLSRATLRYADLSTATMTRACLRGADLVEANLREANLSGADLNEAFLFGVVLTGTRGLTQEQIEKAIGDDQTTKLPDHLHLPEAWSMTYEEQLRRLRGEHE